MELYKNKFINTIRKNIHNGENITNFPCGNWDILNREQRVFMLECADYMEILENFAEERVIKISLLQKELEVYKKALELACVDLSLYEDITSANIKIKCFIDQARKELEEQND